MSDIYGFRDVPAARVVVKNGHKVSDLELLEDIQKLQAENAELTKRDRYYKSALLMLMDEVETKEFCHNVMVTDAYYFAADLAKGDSDE